MRVNTLEHLLARIINARLKLVSATGTLVLVANLRKLRTSAYRRCGCKDYR